MRYVPNCTFPKAPPSQANSTDSQVITSSAPSSNASTGCQAGTVLLYATPFPQTIHSSNYPAPHGK